MTGGFEKHAVLCYFGGVFNRDCVIVCLYNTNVQIFLFAYKEVSCSYFNKTRKFVLFFLHSINNIIIYSIQYSISTL